MKTSEALKKELRKRNKTGVTATTKRDIGHSKELSFGFPPPVTSDQAISFESGTPPNERAPDPGLKRQATSGKLQAASLTAAGSGDSNRIIKEN